MDWLYGFIGWLFPSKAARLRERFEKAAAEIRDWSERLTATSDRMADVGCEWLDGQHDQFGSLEDAMLSAEPEAPWFAYSLAMSKVIESGRPLRRPPKEKSSE